MTQESTGCTASIGSAGNRLVARIATKRAKPNGYFQISPAQAQGYLAPLPVSEIPGVGYHMVQKLHEKCIQTCEQLVGTSKQLLQREFGDKMGQKLYDCARGIDTRKYVLCSCKRFTFCTILQMNC
jgi:DNA repair protein REV1